MPSSGYSKEVPQTGLRYEYVKIKYKEGALEFINDEALFYFNCAYESK